MSGAITRSDRLAVDLGLFAGQRQKLGQAFGLEAQPALAAGHAVDHDHRQRDPRDDDHHQQFDQREAAVPAPDRSETAMPAAQSPHDPMSASTPLPPGCPSAPRLKTSISPFTPGFRY